MSWDYSVTSWLNSFSGKIALLDSVFVAITMGGPIVLVALIAVRWWIKVQRELQRHLAIACAMATLLGLFFNQLILLFYHRPRPYESQITHLIIQKSSDPSFPSDHATVGFAIVMMLVLCRDKWAVGLSVIAILICVSRIYVGTHFVTDVIGGAVTGLMAALITHLFYHKLEAITQRVVKLL